MSKRWFIAGGAGFIGSHFTDALLAREQVERVTLYDNFSSGREWHFAHHANDTRLNVVRGEIRDTALLQSSIRDHDTVIHLASNPDIARAATEPDIDFHEGTFLTHQIVEAMRVAGVPQILYASGSGVYGDIGSIEAEENRGPLLPVSTYGASKLAGEALICSYAHMFGLRGCAFRFGNVVGPRQTHGVGFDFIRRLLVLPTELTILGDGSQTKSYIHVSDVVNAVLMAADLSKEPFSAFNVATGDYITVTEIAHLAIECLELSPSNVKLRYTGGDRGWKGDVPIVRLNTGKIQSLGWRCRLNTREALQSALQALLADAKLARL